MSSYRPPVDDMLVVLRHLAELDGLLQLPAFTHVDADAVEDLLREAGRFVAEVVAPTNLDGDRVGSVLNPDGSVTAAPGFADAYRRYVAAGWPAAPFPPEIGGGGLPWVVGSAVQEMVTAANMAFSLCPLLTQGAVHALAAHGSPSQQARWLPRLVSGEWTATMNLTEPQAGSDVGALTTRAVRQDDGTYRISGQKIFITWGEHDLADNIVHLVLARTADAPPGTRGISCFVVPKFVVGADGSPGAPNGVECVSIEHKMGLHGSPTCVLSFEDARGELIGDEQAGMRYMFTMMNNARLSVGLEGLGVADRAYQQALGFAHERRQGRRGAAAPGEASPIVEHPDVRRMLLRMRSLVEAMRALCYVNAAAIDRAAHCPDDAERAASQELADLLTPLSKAWCTDRGAEVASLGIQVHEGMGYVEETGAAQHYRDVRVASIYEGTNGIQAIDLVGRKLPMRSGTVVHDLLGRMEATVGELGAAGHPVLAERLDDAVRAARDASGWLLDAEGDDVWAGATAFLELLAATIAGWLLCVMLLGVEADAAAGRASAEVARDKRLVTRCFLTQVLPPAAALVHSVRDGASGLETV